MEDLLVLPDQVGSAWTKKAQADVVGINRMEKTLILGECKWSPQVMDKDVLENLFHKTSEFVPPDSRWRMYYLGFARGGWSSAARQFAGTITQTQSSGENWQVVGMQLLDLKQVDTDLTRWSQYPRTAGEV